MSRTLATNNGSFDNFHESCLCGVNPNARQTREVALLGADIATLPLYVIKEMIGHHKTREGMKNFVKDVIPEYVELTK